MIGVKKSLNLFLYDSHLSRNLLMWRQKLKTIAKITTSMLGLYGAYFIYNFDPCISFLHSEHIQEIEQLKSSIHNPRSPTLENLQNVAKLSIKINIENLIDRQISQKEWRIVLLKDNKNLDDFGALARYLRKIEQIQSMKGMGVPQLFTAILRQCDIKIKDLADHDKQLGKYLQDDKIGEQYLDYENSGMKNLTVQQMKEMLQLQRQYLIKNGQNLIKKIFAATSKWPVEDLKKLKPHLVLVIEEVALLEREDLQIWNGFKKYSDVDKKKYQKEYDDFLDALRPVYEDFKKNLEMREKIQYQTMLVENRKNKKTSLL